MRVVIETVTHESQRYPTVGDWWWDHDTLFISVSFMNDWRMEMAVAFHEFFEALACEAADISENAVDKFDKKWRPRKGIEEPGDDPKAPYYRQHQMATVAERLLANEIGLNWQEYEEAVKNLSP